MPQPKKGARLGSNPSHQRLMLSNLALSLFENERIKTTEAKAKLLRPYAERLITKAKHGTVHHRRQVLATIENREVVHKLFAEIAPRFADRNGGYTRIMKLGPRLGDGAEMALIELVDSGAPPSSADAEPTSEAEGRRRRLRRRRTDSVTDLPQDKPTRSRAAEAAAAGGTAAGKTELDTGEVAEVGKEEEAEAASLSDDDAAGAEQGGAGQTTEQGAPPDDAPTTGGDAGAR